MKIAITDFLNLPPQEQLDIVLNIGYYIQSRPRKEKQEILYAIDKFFVELHFDHSVNKISEIVAFDSGEILNKYSGEFQWIL